MSRPPKCPESVWKVALEAYDQYTKSTGDGPHQIRHRQVKVDQWLLKELPTPAMAVVFAQLRYWLTGRGADGKPRAHKPVPSRGLDKPWIAKPAEELADEIGLKVKTVQNTTLQLRDAYWIGCRPLKYYGAGPLWGLTVSHAWLGDHGEQMLTKASSVGGDPQAVYLYRWAMEATGRDLVPGMVLSRIFFLISRRNDDGWFLSKPGADPDSRWVVATTEELSEWLCLSASQVKRALKKLREMKLIETGRMRFGRGVPNKVTIDIQRCLPLVVLYRADDARKVATQDPKGAQPLRIRSA